jgi:hypothetical protein
MPPENTGNTYHTLSNRLHGIVSVEGPLERPKTVVYWTRKTIFWRSHCKCAKQLNGESWNRFAAQYLHVLYATVPYSTQYHMLYVGMSRGEYWLRYFDCTVSTVLAALRNSTECTYLLIDRHVRSGRKTYKVWSKARSEGALHKQKMWPLNSTTPREPIRAKVCTELSCCLSLPSLSLWLSLTLSLPFLLGLVLHGLSRLLEEHCYCWFDFISDHPSLLVIVVHRPSFIPVSCYLSPVYMCVDLALLCWLMSLLSVLLFVVVSFFNPNQCFHESFVAPVICCSLHLIPRCWHILQ